MFWTLELAGSLDDAPWPATKDELIDYANRSGAPEEVIENLQELEDDGNGGLSLCAVEYKPYVCATEYEKWEILGTWFPLKKYCDIPQVAKAVVAISMELPNYISEETAVVG